MEPSEKDVLHIVAIVRALKDVQRFLGSLTAEEFVDNDEKQNAPWQSRERGARQEAVGRVSEDGIGHSLAWSKRHARLDCA